MQKMMNRHLLPPISQPILSTYRMSKPGSDLIIEENQSLWCSVFGGSGKSQLNLCRCERTGEGYCELVMGWIEEYYDWRGDRKFSKTYRSYTRRNMDLFLTDS